MTTLSKDNLARHKAIAHDLRTQIALGALKPGGLIPSYRSLMEQHAVTVGTVRQALATLQAQGLIKSVPGVGCIVATPLVKRLRVGIVVVGASESPGFVQQLSLMHDELDRLHCDVGIRFMPTVDEPATLALAAWARRHDGVLLNGRIPVALAQAMEATQVPCVLLGEPADGPCPQNLCNVTLDLTATASLAVGLLAGLGHTRIAICTRPGSRYVDLLQNAFQASLAQHDLPPGPVFHFQGKRETDYTNAVAWLKALQSNPSSTPGPTALVVEEGSRAVALLAALTAAGIDVPGQVSLLAIVPSKKPPTDSQSTLSRILTPTHDLVLQGASMIAQNLHSGTHIVRIQKIIGSYLPGHTIRHITP